MEINTTTKDIVDIAMAKLKNGEPMSHLRCGDGEIAIMNPNKFPSEFEMFSKRHLGYKIDLDVGHEIKKLIEFGIINSDILGLPDFRHTEHPSNKLWKIIGEEYTRVFDSYKIVKSDKKYCSIHSHYNLLKSGELDVLIKSVDKITLITCRNIENEFKRRFENIRTVELMLIPPQQKYEIVSRKSDFFPDVHDKVVDSIRSSPRNGQLCLFGSGFCGKDFGAHFKIAGGVAIDVGSVFDLWCGKLTRGKGKGKTARIEDYVL
jgi:hypothetical protein